MPGLAQPILSRNNIKVGVVDFYEAPVNTEAADNTGLWKYLGIVEPGSFKFDPKQDLFMFESGVPATTKQTFVIGMKGEADLNLQEYTMNAVRTATGQREPTRYYENLAIALAPRPLAQPAYDGFTIYAQGGDASVLQVGDQIRIPTNSPIDFGEGVGLESSLITRIADVGGGVKRLTVYPKINGTPLDLAAGVQAVAGAVTVGAGGSLTAIAAFLNAGGGYAPDAVYSIPVRDTQVDGDGNPAPTGVGAVVVGITDNTGKFVSIVIQNPGNGYVDGFVALDVPAPAAGSGVKRLSGYKQLVGTTTTREMAYRAVFTDAKGDQAVIWMPKALATGGLSPNWQDGKKNAMLPVKLTAYGVAMDDALPGDVALDPTLSGQPIVAVKYVIRTGGTASNGQALNRIAL